MNGREILIGVTGGIAAYKTAALVSRLAQAGAGVSVVMTAAAQRFVGPTTFAALTGRKVYCDLWDEPEHPLGPHIQLAERASIMCVAPATANLLGKLAHGQADDLLSTLLLVYQGPLLLAPAMNTQMWQKPSVQRNVAQVREDGAHLVGPDDGWLSCRQQGAGRMAEPEEIESAIRKLLENG